MFTTPVPRKSVLAVGIDQFTAYRHTYGRASATALYAALVDIARSRLTETGYVTPANPDRGCFVVCTSSEVADAIVSGVQAYSTAFPPIGPTKITLSIGRATGTDNISDAIRLINHADRCLRIAYDRGGNQLAEWGATRRCSAC